MVERRPVKGDLTFCHMARIPERNPRFRTKRQICEDVAHILNAPLAWGTQHAVIAEALWVWSEFDGKYAGCRRWSEKAWAMRHVVKELRHDHAVPKKLLIERLKRLTSTATVNDVEEVLQRYCIGVVITRDEDRLLNRIGLQSCLPDGCDDDPLARYRAADIALRASPTDTAP